MFAIYGNFIKNDNLWHKFRYPICAIPASFSIILFKIQKENFQICIKLIKGSTLLKAILCCIKLTIQLQGLTIAFVAYGTK